MPDEGQPAITRAFEPLRNPPYTFCDKCHTYIRDNSWFLWNSLLNLVPGIFVSVPLELSTLMQLSVGYMYIILCT